jgi:predicted negative regulator of RcsB-dependent stress response
MKIRTSIVSLAAASMIAASPLAMLNNAAAAATPSAAQETVDTRDQAIIKTVDEAIQGLRQVHAARLAIFNGQTDDAIKYAAAAEQEFAAVEKASSTHEIMATSATGETDAYVPFDMSVGLAEGFVPSEEMAGSLREASQQFEQGNQKNAVEVLRLANIEITVNAGLLPAKSSLAHIQGAIKLLGEKKYYEANLALKALEDSVVFESYSADTIPAQGSNS